MSLREIQESVQQIAWAVASVLRVEVEIADTDLMRIAGTGRTQAGVLHTMAGQDHVYRSSLFAGQPVVITRPGEDERCRPCAHFGNCAETGEICCPIMLDGQKVGVIGLLAFDQEQRERLFSDVSSILNFLQKMAELISIKLKEHLMYVEQQLALEKLRVVMDDLDKAMLTVDQGDRIVQANQRARQFLQLGAQDCFAALDITAWLAAIREADQMQANPKKVVLEIGHEAKEFLFSLKPIVLDGKIREWVITLDDVEEVVEIARQVGGYEREDAFAVIVGSSPSIQRAKDVARRVAESDSTVLLQGESGTGKELFAKAIHQASQRNAQPFISINCTAIPEQLLESELFGYEEGSFTGARKGGKQGLFELAGSGTLFLDEIGDMPLHLQGKLLRVLQEKEVQRVGGAGKAIPVHARIIAATHLDLPERVTQGLFRMDLFYRLHVIPIHLPSLRDRREDILTLANRCLIECATRLGKPIVGFSQETKALLFHHDWPGNVRELANVIEYAVNMETAASIQATSLPGAIVKARKRDALSASSGHEGQREGLLSLKEMERLAIAEALLRVQIRKGRKEEAAELLGISRASLFRKMKEYGLSK
ncbi:ATPase AAA [Brevibacillus reuszeri]|uniref:ATPase AAA n=1 Tax=Brevibacillus reuszeri TaxID=54915 RepID=A0A0K9YK88_9BACL|nr:sigma 54-interacting transcriptional regulator [Brevibacillus reuszeri]KNB68610.1 transcriptional regulator [Brevibacillus reuszeri]MED1858895.1 sigma 54-interacting transcriptional regulator [Brevibacillus reuszeri]GED69109.1 ATPase AAA [Brevibacillus reuszeri]